MKEAAGHVGDVIQVCRRRLSGPKGLMVDKYSLPSNNLAMMLSMLSLSVSAIVCELRGSLVSGNGARTVHWEADEHGLNSSTTLSQPSSRWQP